MVGFAERILSRRTTFFSRIANKRTLPFLRLTSNPCRRRHETIAAILGLPLNFSEDHKVFSAVPAHRVELSSSSRASEVYHRGSIARKNPGSKLAWLGGHFAHSI